MRAAAATTAEASRGPEGRSAGCESTPYKRRTASPTAAAVDPNTLPRIGITKEMDSNFTVCGPMLLGTASSRRRP
jgi:hypothetical protein